MSCETGGTVASVKFYRESNGTGGLQTGTDTLVGSGTQSGSTWSLIASTTGLAAGTYTFYAVATDAKGASSAVYSTTLTVTTMPDHRGIHRQPGLGHGRNLVTLAAANVIETGGTVASVKFYRESNGATGLQTGSDTLVGSGTQSGSTWSLTASTRDWRRAPTRSMPSPPMPRASARPSLRPRSP